MICEIIIPKQIITRHEKDCHFRIILIQDKVLGYQFKAWKSTGVKLCTKLSQIHSSQALNFVIIKSIRGTR